MIYLEPEMQFLRKTRHGMWFAVSSHVTAHIRKLSGFFTKLCSSERFKNHCEGRKNREMDDDLLPLLGIGVVQEDDDEEGIWSFICYVNTNVILYVVVLYQSEFARIDCAYHITIIFTSASRISYLNARLKMFLFVILVFSKTFALNAKTLQILSSKCALF